MIYVQSLYQAVRPAYGEGGDEDTAVQMSDFWKHSYEKIAPQPPLRHLGHSASGFNLYTVLQLEVQFRNSHGVRMGTPAFDPSASKDTPTESK